MKNKKRKENQKIKAMKQQSNKWCPNGDKPSFSVILLLKCLKIISCTIKIGEIINIKMVIPNSFSKKR
jgi:hypothetical protein